ncbi:MAG: hypothetical protein HOW73_27615 [Polyangiaceae bacterium]|nr:hypothetical protein [Polyangiaceae bacterium]
MSDPRRLLSDPSAFDGLADESLARNMLESATDVSPPAGAKAQIWGRLEGVIGAAAVGSAGSVGSTGGLDSMASAPSTTSTSVSAGSSTANAASTVSAAPTASAAPAATATVAAKGIALGTKLGLLALLGGAGLVVGTLATRPAPELSGTTANGRPIDETISSVHIDAPIVAATSGVAMAEAAAPADPAAHVDPAERFEQTSAPSSAALDRSASSSSKARTASEPSATDPHAVADSSTTDKDKQADKLSSLLRESDGVKRARALLASGDAAGALAELRALDSEVARGVLGQERRVVAIEALAASGKREEAGKLARAFIEANPTSPYAKRLAPYASP